MTDPYAPLAAALRAAETCDAVELEHAHASVVEALCDGPPAVVRIGRYVVLERVGRGTSGVVYSAYDPELHRRVAVKVLRPANLRILGATELLLREARAIARLSHPNVVAVHDVGTMHDVVATVHADGTIGAGVFVVMELVDGEPLDRWLEQPRSWSEVLEALVPVGRALVAAHRHGLVHRDVKPGNVLLGSDGRPRLADFGLVCLGATTFADAGLGAGDPFRGVVVGTPATMAPEQHLGKPADARTDQYGFCATLHIALHGCLPFAAAGLDAMLFAKRTQRPVASSRPVPTWLTDVIERGLSPDPAARFVDMGQLLAALERGRSRSRRRVRAALGALALGAVIAVGLRAPEATAAERCLAGGEAAIAAAWNDDTRASVRAGLTATGAPRADAAATTVASSLDELIEEWRTARAEACAGVTVDGPSERALIAEIGCLDGIVVEIDELAQLLGDADVDVAHAAAEAARGLTSPQECSESTDQASARELDLVLRRARLHESAGKIDSAVGLAEQALADARRRGDATAEARARAITCRAAKIRRGREEAERTCEAALLAAERTDHDSLVTVGLIRVVEAMHGRGDAERLYGLAEARVAGRPRTPAWMRIDLMLALVRVHEAHQRLPDAARAAHAALRFAESAFAPEDPELLAAVGTVASLDFRTGRLADAEAAYERAIELTAYNIGADSPDMGALLHNLGGLQLERGDPAAALGTLVRALGIKTAIAGVDSLRIVNTLHRIARAWSALGERRPARAVAERALLIARAGADPLLVGWSELVIASVAKADGRCQDALAAIARAEVHLAAANAGDDDVGEARHISGECRAELGDPRARGDLEDAIAALSRFYGDDARDLVPSLVALARWIRAQGDDATARASLLRAREIVANTEGDPAQGSEIEAAFSALL